MCTKPSEAALYRDRVAANTLPLARAVMESLITHAKHEVALLQQRQFKQVKELLAELREMRRERNGFRDRYFDLYNYWGPVPELSDDELDQGAGDENQPAGAGASA